MSESFNQLGHEYNSHTLCLKETNGRYCNLFHYKCGDCGTVFTVGREFGPIVAGDGVKCSACQVKWTTARNATVIEAQHLLVCLKDLVRTSNILFEDWQADEPPVRQYGEYQKARADALEIIAKAEGRG